MPFQRALTGPTLMVAMAWNSVSEILSSCSQPGMQLLSTSGSLSFAQTTSRLRGKLDFPVHGHRHRPISVVLSVLISKLWSANGESAFVRRARPAAPRSGVGGAARGRLMVSARGLRHAAMTNPLAPSSLLTPLISSAAMRAIVDDRARLQRMLDFEAALARAEAAVGVIPALASRPDRRGLPRPSATTSRRWAKRPSPPAISPSRWSRR